MNDNAFISNYELINKIGSGSFGEVYLAKNISDNNLYATKIEEKCNKNRLKSEYNIYKKINKDNKIMGIPKIYNFIETQDYNIMVMELLGPCLENKFDELDKKISLNTLFKIAIDMFNLIEQFHRRGFIHRDIKPGNFIFNYTKPYNNLYIMDFGLSKQYIVNGEHIEAKFDRSLIGTARYCSLNIHWGIEPSRRDDLESICYILIYFFRGSLPWQGLKKDKKKSQVQKIGEKKSSTSLESLCKDMPDCFKEILKYSKDLKFEEKPNYNYIQDLLNKNIASLNVTPRYEWNDS
jgi:serine/threonine protein kinase